DCSGLQSDFTKLDRPLIKQLLAAGHIRADALRLGVETAAHGAVITSDGTASDDLFAIGPITKGTFWEIVAVPDIRLAGEQLAKHLLTLPIAIAEAATPENLGPVKSNADIVTLPRRRLGQYQR